MEMEGIVVVTVLWAVVTTICWMVVARRAMRAHESLAYQAYPWRLAATQSDNRPGGTADGDWRPPPG